MPPSPPRWCAASWESGENPQPPTGEPSRRKPISPEVQAIIRREIFRGTIRVAPAPGGGIRITPTDGCKVQETELTPRALREHRQPTWREPALQIERNTS